VDVTQVHAPWCATCEKVGRVFEKLAKHVQDVPSLVMAKYDAQENDPFVFPVVLGHGSKVPGLSYACPA
jgi:thiol-disulfide isomerase/thioredoxin